MGTVVVMQASMSSRGAAPLSGARAAVADPSLPPVRAAGVLHVQPGAQHAAPAASKAAPGEPATKASRKKEPKPVGLPTRQFGRL